MVSRHPRRGEAIAGDEAGAQKAFAELRKAIAPMLGEYAATLTESSWRIKAAAWLGQHSRVVELSTSLSRAARREYSLDLARAYLAIGNLAEAEAELGWLIRQLLVIGANRSTPGGSRC